MSTPKTDWTMNLLLLCLIHCKITLTVILSCRSVATDGGWQGASIIPFPRSNRLHSHSYRCYFVMVIVIVIALSCRNAFEPTKAIRGWFATFLGLQDAFGGQKDVFRYRIMRFQGGMMPFEVTMMCSEGGRTCSEDSIISLESNNTFFNGNNTHC